MGVFPSNIAFPYELSRLLGYILTTNAPVRRGHGLWPTSATYQRAGTFGCSDARTHHSVACLGVRSGDPCAVARR